MTNETTSKSNPKASKRLISYDLNEAQIQRLRIDNYKREIRIRKMELQLEETREILEKGIKTKQMKDKIEHIEKLLKEKKDDAGKEIAEGDLEALKVNLKTIKKAFEEKLHEKELRATIMELEHQLRLEQDNLRKVKKQIRERKITTID